MTVKDLEAKRDRAVGSQKDVVDAIYNVGIALIEALDADTEYSGESIFEKIFGGM